MARPRKTEETTEVAREPIDDILPPINRHELKEPIPDEPTEALPTDAALSFGDGQFPSSGTPNVPEDALKEIIKKEQEALKVSRFHQYNDDTKIGVTFQNPIVNPVDADYMPIDQANVRAEGVVLPFGTLDTGAGAQKKEDTIPPADDPRDENFVVCVNKQCQYRDRCLRYRLNNKRSRKFVFFPTDCVDDGIFIDITKVDFTGYDPISILETNSTPHVF